MAVVSFSAQRELMAGVSADDVVVLDLVLSDLDEGRYVERAEHVALGGNREGVRWRAEATWQCVHKPVVIGSDDDLGLRQFLASIEALEVCQFAPYNSSSDSPIDYRNVVITSNGWSLERIKTQSGPDADFVRFSFALVEVP